MTKDRKKRRSFGAIRKLSSGKYQASYQDKYGNRFTAPETFTSYEHADLFLAQKQVEIARGLFIDTRKGKITLKEWWLDTATLGKIGQLLLGKVMSTELELIY